MSKKKLPTTLLARFKAVDGDLRQQLQLAAPIARQSVWDHGLDAEDYLLDNVARLAGSHARFQTTAVDVPEHDLWFAYCAAVQAAFVLGVATAQLVHPDVFKTGGAK